MNESSWLWRNFCAKLRAGYLTCPTLNDIDHAMASQKPISFNARERATRGVTTLLDTIEHNIASGLWQAGTKLPTERELEKQLGVSRNTLRRGLRRLEDQGKIVRHVGRGSFVSERLAPTAPATQFTGSSSDLMASIRGASPVDIMEVRLLIEPAAAELAAHRANGATFTQLQLCLDRMRQAAAIPEYEHWDGLLHVTIMAAARNDLLTTLYTAVNESRNQPEWEQLKSRTVTSERRALYQHQHEQIVAALFARDQELARGLMADHLRTVRDNLFSN